MELDVLVIAQTDLELGQILEAGDGADALQSLEAREAGLVLCDINMPNMDGIEFLTGDRKSVV